MAAKLNEVHADVKALRQPNDNQEQRSGSVGNVIPVDGTTVNVAASSVNYPKLSLVKTDTDTMEPENLFIDAEKNSREHQEEKELVEHEVTEKSEAIGKFYVQLILQQSFPYVLSALHDVLDFYDFFSLISVNRLKWRTSSEILNDCDSLDNDFFHAPTTETLDDSSDYDDNIPQSNKFDEADFTSIVEKDDDAIRVIDDGQNVNIMQDATTSEDVQPPVAEKNNDIQHDKGRNVYILFFIAISIYQLLFFTT